MLFIRSYDLNLKDINHCLLGYDPHSVDFKLWRIWFSRNPWCSIKTFGHLDTETFNYLINN